MDPKETAKIKEIAADIKAIADSIYPDKENLAQDLLRLSQRAKALFLMTVAPEPGRRI